MEKQTITKADIGTLSAGGKSLPKALRIAERIDRIKVCLERDKGQAKKCAPLEEELEMREAELKVAAFRAKRGA